MCGIIVQLPLPETIDKRLILDSIDPELDVDTLGLVASTEFNNSKRDVGSPAALACMYILDSLQMMDLVNKMFSILKIRQENYYSSATTCCFTSKHCMQTDTDCNGYTGGLRTPPDAPNSAQAPALVIETDSQSQTFQD